MVPLFWDMAPHREFVCIGLLKTKALARLSSSSIVITNRLHKTLASPRVSGKTIHPNIQMRWKWFPDKRCINTCGWKIACSHQLTMRIHCTNAKNVGETVAGRTRKAKRTKAFSCPSSNCFPKALIWMEDCPSS